MGPVTTKDPEFWKRADQRLDARLGTRPTRYLVTERSGTSQIDQYFWEKLIRLMGSGMEEMPQAQQIQQQPTATPSEQSGRREFYSDWALAALMLYA